MTTGRVLAACVVHQIAPAPGQFMPFTAIDKRPAPGRVRVDELGLVGDTQCDRRHHGGVEQAVYCYADENAQWWARELGREIPPGLFGENLRCSGIDVDGAEIGEQWQITTPDGEPAVLLEVTSPRIPCQKFTQRMGEPHWVKRFTERGWPGAHTRVLTPGTVGAGDAISVVRRPGHGVTVADVFAPTPPKMRGLLAAEADGAVRLSRELRERAGRVAGRAG